MPDDIFLTPLNELLDSEAILPEPLQEIASDLLSQLSSVFYRDFFLHYGPPGGMEVRLFVIFAQEFGISTPGIPDLRLVVAPTVAGVSGTEVQFRASGSTYALILPKLI